MLLNQLLSESKVDLMSMLDKFLPFAIDFLELETIPKIKFEKFLDDDEQPTFGRFVNDENTIYLGLANRHPIDIIRTLAHELVHYKQGTEHKLHAGSGDTGSPEENEANELAGVMMREFNKANPKFLRAEPVVFPN